MMIKTEYWPKPDPNRSRDWCAWDDNTYEPGCPLGWGPTREAAITDLLEQLQDSGT